MILANYVTCKPFQLNSINNAKQALQSKKIVYVLISVSVQRKRTKLIFVTKTVVNNNLANMFR